MRVWIISTGLLVVTSVVGYGGTAGKIEKLGGSVAVDETATIVEVSLFGTEITDAGLEHLKGLTDLRMLSLVDTRVTDRGVKKLKETLPNCWSLHH